MKILLSALIALSLLACSEGSNPQTDGQEYSEPTAAAAGEMLLKMSFTANEESEEFSFVNQKGETVVPAGEFSYSFSDTILTYGIVVDKTGELVAINRLGQRIYEVLNYDNGPDYPEEGLFRILRNGKIGYADTNGQIAIAPQFACAEPFSGGKAKVALDCRIESQGEHSSVESDGWFYIDKSGQKVN